MTNSKQQAAIIGAGLIGKSWAMVFARAGWAVTLYDSNASVLEAAPAQIRQHVATMQDAGMIEQGESLIANISLQADLELALSGAEYVQECGPEDLETKQELFATMDRLTPAETILASSTSAIVASDFTGNLNGRGRMLVAHPVNPPHLVPLVELSPAEWTDPAVVVRAREIMESLGQTPILVKQEIDGFILNRLQAALLNEAVRLVEGGYVSPEDLDKTVADGLGLRWSFMGPFETIDLNAPAGARDYAARYSPFFQRIVESQSTMPDWSGATMDTIDRYCRSLLSLDAIPAKSVWRDRKLALLRSHKSQISEDGCQYTDDG